MCFQKKASHLRGDLTLLQRPVTHVIAAVVLIDYFSTFDAQLFAQGQTTAKEINTEVDVVVVVIAVSGSSSSTITSNNSSRMVVHVGHAAALTPKGI